MDQTTNSPEVEESEQKKKKKIWPKVVGIILLLLLLLLVFHQCSGPDSGLQQGAIDWNQPTDRDLQEEVNKAVEEGMFNVFMNTNVILENGESEANLLIQNSETNKDPVIVELYIKDPEQLIYTSDEIPVGYKIENDTLDTKLEAGEYDCIAKFKILDSETKDVINQIGVNVTVTVKN